MWKQKNKQAGLVVLGRVGHINNWPVTAFSSFFHICWILSLFCFPFFLTIFLTITACLWDVLLLCVGQEKKKQIQIQTLFDLWRKSSFNFLWLLHYENNRETNSFVCLNLSMKSTRSAEQSIDVPVSVVTVLPCRPAVSSGGVREVKVQFIVPVGIV